MPLPASGLRRRAYICLDAIRSNARVLLGERQPEHVIADVRADAYGHGLPAVTDALADIGIGGFLVSDAHTRAWLAGRHASVVSLAEGDESATDADHDVLGPALYGLAATPGGLRPALRLSAEAVSVKRVDADRGVSYGYTYRTTAETTLVLAGLGYADGVVRAASNRAPVLIGSTQALVTGRIAMDQFVVDVGDATPAVGDEVVLFGDPVRGEPTAVGWATATGLRPEVIVSGLGPRIQREYEA